MTVCTQDMDSLRDPVKTLSLGYLSDDESLSVKEEPRPGHLICVPPLDLLGKNLLDVFWF